MSLSDPLITLREALANALLGVDAGRFLNDFPPLSGGDGTAIAAEIRRAANAFKAAAMDETGARVNYPALQNSPAYAEFRHRCTPALRTFDPETLSTLRERLAFWINLYNVLVIDAVIAFCIQESVTEGFLGLLRFFRRAAYDVGGRRMSAEDIEHGILRANAGHPYLPGPQFGPNDPRRAWVVRPLDARIHFALNCASRSCPPVGVYEAKCLDAQLDLAARSFIFQTVAVDPERKELQLSHIFKWYARDFGGRMGVIETVCRYLPATDERRVWLEQHLQQAHVTYTPYDWTLNV